MIPEDWDVHCFLDVVRIAKGQVDPKVEPYRSMPLVAPDHIESGSGRLLEIKTAEEQKAISGKYLFSAGDIVYSKIRPYLRKAILADFSGLCSADMYPLTPASETSGRFIFESLLAHKFTKYAESVSVRSGMPKINRVELADFQIALPRDPREQRAIAEALADVDAAVAVLEQLISKKRDLKQAAMSQLLTGQTRLPGFSGAWEVKRLEDACSLHKGQLAPNLQPDELFEHFSLPAYDAARKPIFQRGSEIGSNKFTVPKGALLISKLNPRIPRVWAPDGIGDHAVASTEFLVLKPYDPSSRSYIAFICQSSMFCSSMENAVTGTTGSHQRVTPEEAMKLEFPWSHDPAEQTAIAAVLSDMDAELTALQAKLDKTRLIKQAMMQDLLTGRIRLPF